MIIDIQVAVTPQEVRSAISTLSSLVVDCDVPCRLCVLLHGGVRRNFAELDSFLLSSRVEDDNENFHKFSWAIAHEQKVLTFSAKVTRVGNMKKNKLAVLVQPGLVTNDGKWFGKLQQTFLKDPVNMMTVVEPFVNSSLHPNRVLPNSDVSSSMIAFGQDMPAILDGCLGGEENFGRDLRAMVKKLGGNRWTTKAVRHVVLEVDEPKVEEKHAW